MEPPNDNQFTHYYHPHHHHQPQQQTAAAAAAAAPSNGLMATTYLHHHGSSEGTPMVYPQSAPSAVSTQLEPAKRKRGRPRKYGTPEQALAAKKATSASVSKERNEHQGSASATATASSSSYSKKSQLDTAFGHAGQGFTPHVINAVAGEDVARKIVLFMQRSKREVCVLSASGSISSPSLRQPATSGGSITYEGRFEIISLSGSYIHNEVGGRSGGLSVCLSSTDGQIVGGVVVGQLNAAGPVQIIVGTFVIDTKDGAKGDGSGSKLLPSAVGAGGASMSNLGFRSVESSGRNPMRENDGSHYMIQPQDMHMTSTPARPIDWSDPDGRRNASYDFTGRIGHGGAENNNGDYDEHIGD